MTQFRLIEQTDKLGIMYSVQKKRLGLFWSSKFLPFEHPSIPPNGPTVFYFGNPNENIILLYDHSEIRNFNVANAVFEMFISKYKKPKQEVLRNFHNV